MGHGHVVPNEDGSKARCGGPGLCDQCSKEFRFVENKTEANKPSELEALRTDISKFRERYKISDLVPAVEVFGCADRYDSVVRSLEARITKLRGALEYCAKDFPHVKNQKTGIATEAIRQDDEAANER